MGSGTLKSLGAQKTVDYNDPNWQNQIKEWSDGGVTAALAIQPGTGIDSINVVKESGKLITVSGDNNQVSPERNITIRQMEHRDETQEKVFQLLKAISKDEIRVEIEREYDFEQALEGLSKTETRHARGKVVVKGIN